MPIFFELSPGEGVRIDITEIWTLKQIGLDGRSAVMLDPRGRDVALHEGRLHRIGPGFTLTVSPSPNPDRIRLVCEAYVPLIHRHPPRDIRPKRAEVVR